MRSVIAPEPVDWLAEVEGHTIAPWALPFRGPGTFLRRRHLKGVVGWPGWTLLEALARAWARTDTARSYRARFALRQLVARLARPNRHEELMAPSLGALELFAQHQGKKTLLLDLPLLSQLNGDLQTAAVSNPQSRLLRRFRAERADIVRQEQEFALADEIWVGNKFALDLLKARGLPCLPWTPPSPLTPRVSPGTDILLAGMATARNGIFQILEVLERRPEWRLRVRLGDGLEPRELLAHPQVSLARGFESVAAVVAPSWVECTPIEIRQAENLGVPTVATSRACGFTAARLVEVNDSSALEQALEEVLTQTAAVSG